FSQESASCSYSISSAIQSFESGGGSANVNVTAGAGCNWQTINPVSWITVNSGSSASGNGTVNYTVATNATSAGRKAVLVIAGQNMTVEQSGTGGSCVITSISPGQSLAGKLTTADCPSRSQEPGYTADRYTFGASTGEKVVIAITSATYNSRLALISPSGSVIATGDDFNSNNARIPSGNGLFTLPSTGTYLIEATSLFAGDGGDYTISFSRESAGCTYSISSTVQPFESGGGSGSVDVTAAAGCNWQTINPVDWITIDSGNSGSSSGTVSYTVAPNATNNGRQAVLIIAGQNFTVEQSGASGSCVITPISPGQSVSGTLTTGDCPSRSQGTPFTADRYSFNALAGEQAVMSITSATYNSKLALISPSGSVIATGDVFASNDARIPAGDGLFNLPLTGTYLIEVTSLFSGDSGNYILSFSLESFGCAYSLSSTVQSFESGGGSGSVIVTTAAECNWQVTNPVSWINITSGSGGTGTGTVTYSVAPSTVGRKEVLIIAGQNFTVEQAGTGGSCQITPISPGQSINGSLTNGDCPSRSQGSPFHADRYSFNAPAGDQVVISTSSATFNSKLALLSPSGAVLATGDEFGSNDARVPPGSGTFSLPFSGTYLIEVTSLFSGDTGNYTVSLSVLSSGCTYVISPMSQTFGANGGSSSISVTAPAGCTWGAVSNAGWISVTSGSSGNGNGTVNYSAAANLSSVVRSGTLSIADKTFTVTQSASGGGGPGDECSTATVVSSTPYANTQDATAASKSATDPVPCAGSGSYSLWYKFTPASNGTITSDTFGSAFDTVLAAYIGACGTSQTRLACDDDTSGLQSQISFSANAGVTYFFVITSFGSTAGNLTFHLSFVSTACSYSISPVSQNYPGSGGIGSVTVTAGAGCAWTATSGAAWITITSGNSGSGNGTVNFSVAVNADSAPRTGTLTIAGQTFTVSQAAGCSFSISPTSQSFTAAGGTGATNVTAPAGCAWAATSNAAFITITSGGSGGSGNGTVNFSVALNAGASPRGGTLTIAGLTFTVTQDGSPVVVRTINLISPLPKITDPVIIDGTTQPGFAGRPIIELNASAARGSDVLNITAGSSTIRGLVINHFNSGNRAAGILLITNGGNLIEACFIGTDSNGTSAAEGPSGPEAVSAGVSVRGSPNNTVGGTTTAARNIIAGLDGNGINISNGTTGTLVRGNFIGSDVTGSTSLGNQRIGVNIAGSSQNTIGGTVAGAANLLSGNVDWGVFLQVDALNNLVQGNFIGTNAIGTGVLGNGNAGVRIALGDGAAASSNTVGGTTVAARNVISGNDAYGVVISPGAADNLVQGNFIGINAAGTGALGNDYGVLITQATGSVVGGAVAGARNVISGNYSEGIHIGFLNGGLTGGTGATVQGNYVGTDAAGTAALGNGLDGVFVDVNSVTHVIAENVIAFNARNGVCIPNETPNGTNPGVRISITSNSIYSNGVLGIDLGPSGVTPNDPGDADEGANRQQNFPVLTSATVSNAPNGTVRIQGNLNSTPNTDFFIQFFSSDQCQNENPGGAQNVLTLPILFRTGPANGNPSGVAPIDVTVNNVPPSAGWVNATARDTNGNTSEFSLCVPLTDSVGCMLTCNATVPATASADSAVEFMGSATPSNCTGAPLFDWDFGDGTPHSSLQTPLHTYALTGTFNWMLTTTISGASPCIQSGSIVITPPCTLACSATVPGNATLGSPVQFTGSATAANCAGSAVFDWDFGDGTAHSSQQSPFHAYAQAQQFGWTLTVTISGASPCTHSGTIDVQDNCSFLLSQTSASFGAGGGAGSVGVTAPNGCGWQATSNSAFITITSGANGSGNGTVFYSVAPNLSGTAQSGTMTIAGQSFTVTQAGSKALFDYDGDSKSDLAVWRPAEGLWFLINSSNSATPTFNWGVSSDVIVPGDYDGDGRTDISVWRPSTGTWFIINSGNQSVTNVGWGVSGDIPVPGDYDADGKTDIAVWRPSTGVWF
ncbi:MAG: BACON domain-containing carbohydrate-binding protein, partial [Blastocatellia bacterium]